MSFDPTILIAIAISITAIFTVITFYLNLAKDDPSIELYRVSRRENGINALIRISNPSLPHITISQIRIKKPCPSSLSKMNVAATAETDGEQVYSYLHEEIEFSHKSSHTVSTTINLRKGESKTINLAVEPAEKMEPGDPVVITFYVTIDRTILRSRKFTRTGTLSNS